MNTHADSRFGLQRTWYIKQDARPLRKYCDLWTMAHQGMCKKHGVSYCLTLSQPGWSGYNAYWVVHEALWVSSTSPVCTNRGWLLQPWCWLLLQHLRFQIILFAWKIVFWLKLYQKLSWRAKLTYLTIINADNWHVSSKWQAKFWTNACIFHRHIYSSLDLTRFQFN